MPFIPTYVGKSLPVVRKCVASVLLRTVMMRFVTTLLLPIWLLAGCLAMMQPLSAQAKTAKKAKTETKISQVEAAPVVILQVQAPQPDWLPAQAFDFEIHQLPENQSVPSLRANGRTVSSGFGLRCIKYAVALRAP